MVESVKLPDKEAVLKLLNEEKIEFKMMEHEALDTMQAGLDYFEKNKPEVENYVFAKNLFLKNKAGGYYLLTLHHKTASDFKTLTKVFKAKSGNIRQAEEEKLEAFLHVKQGSVTPLALLNLSEEQRKEVQFHLDKAIDTEYISVHPMKSTSTIFMKTQDLIKLLEKHGIKVNVTDFIVKEEPKKEEAPKEKKEKKPKENAKKDKDKDKDEDISLLGIVNKKEENFSDWFSEVITKSEMIEYYEISGCYIIRPWAYQIWEFIQNYFDKLIKTIDVENAYFPMFVSKRVLFKEKEHVEGFSPEVAWVTKSGSSEIDPPIAIRPTSETIMYPAFAKWIRSHRDLPLKINQWTNIVRWEFKNPTPFIRTREFLWQEGHTAHATLKECEEMVDQALEFYRLVYEDLLACPVVPGRKSENEKFAGAYYTTSIETMIPTNGKGVQCATSHNLGQNFSKMFEICYLDKEKKKQFAWQSSWGLTTRTIGVLIMMHSDNSGLVLPPKVAPLQVVIVPIKTSKDDPKPIQDKGEEIFALLKANGIRVKFDDSELHTPGWKYAQWELKGVPIRIEYGAKDLSKDQVTFFCRDTKEKFPVKFTEIKETVDKYLDIIQKRLFDRIKKVMDEKRTNAEDFDTFLKGLNAGNLVFTPWCNEAKCEDDVKAKVKAIAIEKQEEDSVGTCKTLNIPKNQPKLKEGTKCFFCGKDAKVEVMWGRSY